MTLRAALAWSTLLVVALWLPWPAAAQTVSHSGEGNAQLTVSIGKCVPQLDATPIRWPDLDQRCPDLAAVLQAVGIRALIIDAAHASVDRQGLLQLPNLIRPLSGPAPSVAALDSVLRGLRGAAPAPSRSWLQRLWDWLVEHLMPKRQAADPNAWVNDLLRALARVQWLWTGIIWVTLIVLPVAVGYVVVREVRAMGRRSLDEPVASNAASGAVRLQSRLAQLHGLPRAQQPAQLFALLISRLVASGRLAPDRSLTHREVARRALLDDREQRRLIESLARLSERQLYASVAIVPTDFDELLARAEDLYTTGWGRPVET
jgi:hypothetical protein